MAESKLFTPDTLSLSTLDTRVYTSSKQNVQMCAFIQWMRTHTHTHTHTHTQARCIYTHTCI